eukprot:scaffold21262_cov30-Tisochrysis_lutea.AAC.5
MAPSSTRGSLDAVRLRCTCAFNQRQRDRVMVVNQSRQDVFQCTLTDARLTVSASQLGSHGEERKWGKMQPPSM